MSVKCMFVKVSKQDGFVRENNWQHVGIIGCSDFIGYIDDAIDLNGLDIGDSICIIDKDKEKYYDILSQNDFETFVKVREDIIGDLLLGNMNEEVNYRLTPKRIKAICKGFKKWSKNKSAEEITSMRSMLEQFKDLLKEVDFKTEYLVFSFDY